MAETFSQKINNGVKEVFFEDIFPNEFIEDNFIIRSDGNLAAGFQMTFPEIESQDEDAIVLFQEKLNRVFSQLPVGTFAHLQSQFFFKDGSLSGLDEIAKGFISDSMVEHLHDRPLLFNKVLCFLTFNFNNQKVKNPLSTFFANFTKTLESPLAHVEKRKVMAKGFVQTFLTGLLTLPELKVQQLNNNGLAMEKLRYFNLQFESDPTEFTADHTNNGHEIIVGNKVCSVVYMRKSGNELYRTALNDRKVNTYMAWPMGYYLHFPHVVNLSFQVADTEAEMNALDTNKNIRSALGSFTKQIDRLISTQIEEFTAEIRNDHKQVVWMNHNVMTWDVDRDKLSIKIDMIKTAYQSMNGSKGMVDSFNTGSYYYANSPGYSMDMFQKTLMTMEDTLLHFDFTSPTVSENRGVIFCNRNLDPVLVDLWTPKLPSFNRIVIGPSGSGKSFTMNHLLAQEIEQGIELVIIDVGGSYKNIVQINNGKYFEYTEDNPIKFNPFLFPTDKNGKFTLRRDKLTFLLTLITLIWKEEGEALTRAESSVITELLKRYYADVNEYNSKRSKQDHILPRLDRFVKFCEDLKEKSKEDPTLQREFVFFDINSFSIVLRDYTEGVYKEALNSEESVDISSHKILCFDLNGLKESGGVLYPIVSLLIVELVLDKIRENPKTRKEIVIDEAWSLLAGTMAKFIEVLYRTVRKSGGAVTVVAQDVSPIQNSPIGPSIRSNAPIVFLLDHNTQLAQIPLVQEFFKLLDHQVELLRSVRDQGTRRELLLMRGPHTQVLFIDDGPHASAAFSSWSDDRADIADLAKGRGYEYAIKQFVENKNNVAA